MKSALIHGDESYPYTLADIDIPLLLVLAERTIQPGNQYRLGGKASNLKADSAVIRGLGMDCSGYVRWILHKASSFRLTIPDGSVQQGDWFEAKGFKKSTGAACERLDGILRVAQWRNPGGVGHIALVHNGETIESHGGAGPDRREWDMNATWMAQSKIWVVAKP